VLGLSTAVSNAGTLISGAAAAYASRSHIGASAASFGTIAVPNEGAMGASRPDAASSLLFVESAATGEFSRVHQQRPLAAASDLPSKAAGASAASAAAAPAQPSAAESFMLAKLRARSHGGWLGAVADGVGHDDDAHGIGAEPPPDIEPGTSLFDGIASMIGRVARLTEGLLVGVMLIIATSLSRSTGVLHFFNTVGWQMEQVRTIQFLLAWLSWIGEADELARARVLLQREERTDAVTPAAPVIGGSSEVVQRVAAKAALGARISILYVCIIAHTTVCVMIVASHVTDNQLRRTANSIPAADGMFLNATIFSNADVSGSQTWKTLLYIRLVAAFVAHFAASLASTSPIEVYSAATHLSSSKVQ
jgi:hypothetical protein